MNEQRVLYLHDSSVERLVKQMNGLFGMGGEDGTEIESIEHFDILRSHSETSAWIAIVLVRVQPMIGLDWQMDEDETAEIEARQEYETAIGVKPR